MTNPRPMCRDAQRCTRLSKPSGVSWAFVAFCLCSGWFGLWIFLGATFGAGLLGR